MKRKDNRREKEKNEKIYGEGNGKMKEKGYLMVKVTTDKK